MWEVRSQTLGLQAVNQSARSASRRQHLTPWVFVSGPSFVPPTEMQTGRCRSPGQDVLSMADAPPSLPPFLPHYCLIFSYRPLFYVLNINPLLSFFLSPRLLIFTSLARLSLSLCLVLSRQVCFSLWWGQTMWLVPLFKLITLAS